MMYFKVCGKRLKICFVLVYFVVFFVIDVYFEFLGYKEDMKGILFCLVCNCVSGNLDKGLMGV